jgi:hypothetical protein
MIKESLRISELRINNLKKSTNSYICQRGISDIPISFFDISVRITSIPEEWYLWHNPFMGNLVLLILI